jgi:tRNA pseudouridine55 synthase
MNGVIIIDKPQDFTSFDVVAVMRRLCKERKIGHTGTLDPMATGVLPLLLGKATRAASLLEETGKEYVAGFRLGVATDTQDSTGKVTEQSDTKVTKAQLLAVLPQFTGDIMQTPPMYSAVSQNGQRLYKLARQGIEVERQSRPITIEKLVVNEFDENTQTGSLTVGCSKGTYIRTLCADIGTQLQSFGIMTDLRRTRAAGFTLADAITLEEAKELSAAGTLEQKALPIEKLFESHEKLTVTEAQAARFCNGGGLSLERTGLSPQQQAEGRIFRIYSPDQTFLGLGKVNLEKAELSILKLFCER